jgi:hypothetical protein
MVLAVLAVAIVSCHGSEGMPFSLQMGS